PLFCTATSPSDISTLSLHDALPILDVSSFLKEMLQDYQPSFQVEQKSLSWEIQDGIEAQCDREVLAKIIENLLSNALKYAERTVHLILRKTSDGHAWQIGRASCKERVKMWGQAG